MSGGYGGFGASGGARLGLGLRGGSGLSGGFCLGGGLGFGAGGGLGLGLGLGRGAGAGALVASPAFAMGHAVAAGGLGASAALAVGPSSGAAVAPILSRAAEKNTLSGLNDRFSTYMAKVQGLQQENAALEAKLSQLTWGTDVSQESSLTATIEYEAQLSEYRSTLETLTIDTSNWRLSWTISVELPMN